jgi:hypothetical protein
MHLHVRVCIYACACSCGFAAACVYMDTDNERVHEPVQTYAHDAQTMRKIARHSLAPGAQQRDGGMSARG